MSRFTQIDLSQLPAPKVVEALDFETILASIKANILAAMPELSDVMALESEPLVKLAEALAYVALTHRARVNDAAEAVMLAFATGTDLDHLAALFGVERLLVAAATETTGAVYEADAALRLRTQLSLEAFTTAGSIGAYEYHARTASALVADVSVTTPEPGTVLVTILSTEGDGTPDAALLAQVNAALSAEEVRPLCDAVIVAAPELLTYGVVAELVVAGGPDTSVVLEQAQEAVVAYVAAVHALGGTVAISGLHAALHQAGVTRATLTSPAADIETTPLQAPICTAITISIAGV